jgi:circadian clock protein KaiA
LSAPLSIAVLADSTELFPLLGQYLDAERHLLQYFTSQSEFLARVETVKHELDCLVFCAGDRLLPVINYLYDRGLILPVVMIETANVPPIPLPEVGGEAVAIRDRSTNSIPVDRHSYIYQPSEVILAVSDLASIGAKIDTAIAKFLSLTPIMPISDDAHPAEIEIDIPEPSFLLQQQRRLAEKLKERLGYLAVYYKRNPRQFFRHLDRQQKQDLLAQLKSQYRKIVLSYFTESSQINEEIDELIGSAFFSDLSVSEIVKIHMELMEEFSNQLKLEGRSEEILLDYRLTLIDIIAHLCEMYRRSIPRET